MSRETPDPARLNLPLRAREIPLAAHGPVALLLEPVRAGRWATSDPGARLRRLLKSALRAFGWRVLEVRPVAAADIQSTGNTPQRIDLQGSPADLGRRVTVESPPRPPRLHLGGSDGRT
jgi:hypothetical protein